LTLLDTNAVLALLWAEPGGREVMSLLRQGHCAIPAACLGEVVDHLIRRDRIPSEAVAEKLAPLLSEVVSVPVIDQAVGWRAGEIRARHYSRGSSALSHVDCLLLAAAGPDDKIATADAALVAVALELEIGVIPLPDSNGNRPPV
jgi:PIN domain nuclease of toxin-antitoxin system